MQTAGPSKGVEVNSLEWKERSFASYNCNFTFSYPSENTGSLDTDSICEPRRRKASICKL